MRCWPETTARGGARSTWWSAGAGGCWNSPRGNWCRVAFVEVKNWTALGLERLGQAIGAQKRRRIVAAARHFLHEHPPAPGSTFAFDVVLLKGREITHIEDAFDGE